MAVRIKKLIYLASLTITALLLLHISEKVLASNLDFEWGTLRGIRIISEQPLGSNDTLNPGDFWAVSYSIKVKKWFWEGEDAVKNRVREHFEDIIGKVKAEHPEIWIFYAKYEYVNRSCNPLFCEYLYNAVIIGKIMTREDLARVYGEDVVRYELAVPVAVAVIIGLILATLIAGIVLVNQPAVKKLLVAISESIEKAPWVVPLAIGGFFIAIIALTLGVRRH